MPGKDGTGPIGLEPVGLRGNDICAEDALFLCRNFRGYRLRHRSGMGHRQRTGQNVFYTQKINNKEAGLAILKDQTKLINAALERINSRISKIEGNKNNLD